MNFFTRFSLRNAVAVFIISFLLILGGLYSFQKLKLDLLPNIEFPQLSVEIVYPGASPGDLDDKVTSDLEEKFKGVEGVKQVSSSTYETISVINLEFPFNTDMDEVERKVDSLISDSDLPDEVTTDI
ncbi:efflux RND transporter permease subunit, partial [Rossellomorea marisflavi]